MAAIRFYVDADLLALAKSMAAARYDVTFPGDRGDARRGRSACPITRADTKDHVWIPQVAALNWVVVSRDTRIMRKPVEVAAVRSHGLRLVVLDTRSDPTTWNELRIVTSQWDRIDALTTMAGPCAYLATRTTFRRLELP